MSEPQPTDPNLAHRDATTPLETAQGGAESSAGSTAEEVYGQGDLSASASPARDIPVAETPAQSATVATLPIAPAPPIAPAAPLAIPAPLVIPEPLTIPAPVATGNGLGAPVTAPAAAVAPPAKTQPRSIQKAAPSNDPISRFRNKSAEEEARMGFIEHLMELRKRLWISIIAVVVCVVISLIFYKQVYNFLLEPIRMVDRKYVDILTKQGHPPPDGHVIHITTTNPLGTMVMVIWLGFWAGLVVASPIVLYELWAFVAPGLHDKEKNAIKPVLYGGVFFFLTGVAIAYYFLAPMTFDFFLWLDLNMDVTPNWTSETCVEMLITMMIVSGLLCEIPLLVAGLARLNVLEPRWLVKYWKIFTFGSVVLGMIVSPGNDIASMSAFSGLILGIYFVSILMAYIFHRKPDDPNDPKSDKSTRKDAKNKTSSGIVPK